MRLYTCSHYMLSSIQQTIQGGHALGELFANYTAYESPQQYAELIEYVTNHKTWIAKNGGDSDGLMRIIQLLEDLNGSSKILWSVFQEDHSSMRGLITSVAMVLPTEYCHALDIVTKPDELLHESFRITQCDLNVLYLLKSLPLAR